MPAARYAVVTHAGMLDDIDALLWALDPGQVAISTAAPTRGMDWTVCGNANCVTDEECTGVSVPARADTPLSVSHGAAFSTDDTTRIGWFDTADPDGTFAHLGNGNGGVPDSGELAYIESGTRRVRFVSDASADHPLAPDLDQSTWTSTMIEP